MSARSRAGAKPLDVGTGVVCASFGGDGSWLSLGAAHPEHGFIELSGMPPFDEAWRGNPELVRRFRALMTDDRFAFLAIEASPGDCSVSSRTTAVMDEWRIVQDVRITAAGDGRAPERVHLRFSGTLDRPALAEITESDPPPPTGADTQLVADGATLRVRAGALPAEATVSVEGVSPGVVWQVDGSRAELLLPWPIEQREMSLRIICSLMGDAPVRTPERSGFGRVAGFARPTRLIIPEALRTDVERIGHRALRYVMECTALRVAPERVAILTDHRILPLSWTRDAYYQALLLLSAAHAVSHAEDVPSEVDSVRLVADHLRWLWLSCDRPTGAWARSHHANGRRKDERFQVDQQLYPLLELADYWRVSGSLPELPSGAPTWPALVADVIELLEASMSADGLLPTEENAADDLVAHPYLVATQILAWHAFSRLEELRGPLELPASPAAVAARMRDAVLRHFPVEGPAGPMWAYAVDGRGGSTLYHDANDLPTAFAPLWGFCSADDPVWRQTMAFAFGSGNEAYVPGRWGGLGSAHTAGTWSLGLIQEWLAMSLAAEREVAVHALERLVGTAFPDGSLPEASDPDTGRAAARHWFAWPGALVGALLGRPRSTS